MTPDELAACPFCGGDAIIESTVMDAVAKCTGCYARILRRHDSERDEIAICAVTRAWNTRAQGGEERDAVLETCKMFREAAERVIDKQAIVYLYCADQIEKAIASAEVGNERS